MSKTLIHVFFFDAINRYMYIEVNRFEAIWCDGIVSVIAKTYHCSAREGLFQIPWSCFLLSVCLWLPQYHNKIPIFPDQRLKGLDIISRDSCSFIVLERGCSLASETQLKCSNAH